VEKSLRGLPLEGEETFGFPESPDVCGSVFGLVLFCFMVCGGCGNRQDTCPPIPKLAGVWDLPSACADFRRGLAFVMGGGKKVPGFF
jgi:hypothetical protein